MCGIAGVYRLDQAILSLETLQRFTDSMGHRGPDGSGYKLLDEQILGLGHRRLSILDISKNGSQPMSYQHERYWITFNGEIFNFLDIKSELIKKGYTFISESDTEVILASYNEWGKECLHKFNGMWSFAIWDDKNKELFIARDRFGIKPLYYLLIPRVIFAFASETRAFKYLDQYQRIFDNRLLQLNLEDSYSLEGLGYTPFKDIVQLLPGHYMLIGRKGTNGQKRWWDIQDHLITDVPGKIEDQATAFFALFKDSCKIRLISDVPVATALSGGLDSTAVYSTVFGILQKDSLNRVNKDSQRAFTAIFPGLDVDEKEYAEKAVKFTKGDLTFIEPDFSTLGDDIVKETELADFINPTPINAISSIYKGMRKNGIVVSLDGHGVDEMMYGYRDMVYSLYNYTIRYKNSKEAAQFSTILNRLYHPSLQAELINKRSIEIQRKRQAERGITYRLKQILKQRAKNTEYLPERLPALSNKPYDFERLDIYQRMVYYEFFQHTLPALLRNFDRAGMINSVEIRMPFMDWRLVTFVFSLPYTSKIGDGYTKLLLRKAMEHQMSEEIRTRTFKVGIGTPLDHWFNTYLKDWLLEKIKSKELKSEMEKNIKRNLPFPSNLNKRVWEEINISALL